MEIQCVPMTDLAPTLAMPQALETRLIAAAICMRGERRPYEPLTPAGPPSPEALAYMATLAWCERPKWVVQPRHNAQRMDVDKTVFYRRLVQGVAADIINS